MSYAALLSFSGIAPWRQTAAETDEVYVWRAMFDGFSPRNIQDVQAIAAAAGKHQNLAFDLRGVALHKLGSDSYQVDAVFSTKIPRLFAVIPWADDADSLAVKIKTALVSRFPSLQIKSPQFLEINDDDPKHPALDFWLAHQILWDTPVFGTGEAVPTSAFARFEGLYQGKAEDGLNLKLWPKEAPKPEPNGGPGVGPPKEGATLVWFGLGAIALWVVFKSSEKRTGAAA